MSIQTTYDVNEIAKTLVTEDDEPVDNYFCGVQQRLFVEPLSYWTPPIDEDNPISPRPFVANANVGIFYTVHEPPLVPDMFLSLDVQIGPDWENTSDPRSYFVWHFGKVPEVAVEIVSNSVGNELSRKLREYAKMGIIYYVVFDPWFYLGDIEVRVYELGFGRRYRLRDDLRLPDVGLSLTIWQGEYENLNARWLRWCDLDGNLIPTGKEYSQRETKRAQHESERAQHEAERAERLAAKLREMGIDPEQI